MDPPKTTVDLLDAPRDENRLQYEENRLNATKLEAQLAALTAEHAELIDAILGYEAASAPWKQAPDEVLQRIFQWTKAEEPPACVPFSKTVAPMQLTQVCSKWRAVAHDTPTIWQGLKCPVYLPPNKYERQETIAFIQSWASRAAYMPLSFDAIPLDLESGVGVVGPPMYQQGLYGPTMGAYRETFPSWLALGNKFNLIKDIVIPNASRIRDLHINFPPYYRHTVAVLQKDVDFPLLEDVAVDFDEELVGMATSATAPTYSFLANAPRLRKFNFGSFHMTNPTQIPVNWSHLTHFETAMISLTAFVQILGQMTSLQSCKASLDSLDFVQHLQWQPAVPVAGPQLVPGNLQPIPVPNAFLNFQNVPNLPLIAPPNPVNVPNLAPNVGVVPNLPGIPNLPVPANAPNAPNPPAPPFPNVPNMPNFAPNFLQNLQNAFVFPGNMPAAPAAVDSPVIRIPSLHTLNLKMGYRPAAMFPTNGPLDNLEFPNLKKLTLMSSEGCTLTRSLFKSIISLSEFHLQINGSSQSDVLRNTLKSPVLSQLTHLSIRVKDMHSVGPAADTIDQETMKAIAEGQLLPQLHTFHFEGHLWYPSLINLLATKGFVSGSINADELEGLMSASIIYPDIGPGKSARPAEGFAGVPFEKVKLYRCESNYLVDPALMRVQELVGEDRFAMEMSEVEQWGGMNQIDWNTDE